ncbi:hypothetical protein TKK_0018201 [Trichogramma kaykai]
MENEVKTILNEWGFAELQLFFQVHKIHTKEQFNTMSTNDIEKIIPENCDLKAEFQNLYKTYLKVNKCGLLQNAYSNLREWTEEAGIHAAKTRAQQIAPKKKFKQKVNVIDLSILNDPNFWGDKEKVIEIWQESFGYRFEHVIRVKKGLDIIKEYDVSKSSFAAELINLDYSSMYQDKNTTIDINTKWPPIAQNIIAYARSTLHDDIVKTVANTELETDYGNVINVLQKNSTILNIEHANILGFLLIPHLIKYTTKSTVCKYRPSKKKIVEYFIQHIQDHTLIDTLMTTVEKIYLAF